MLNACASDPEVRIVTRTEIVEKEVEVYRPLPSALTDPIPVPALPERFTERELWEAVFTLYDLALQANEDRATAGRIASGAE